MIINMMIMMIDISSNSIKRSILKLLIAPNELRPKSELEFLRVQMIMFNSAVP